MHALTDTQYLERAEPFLRKVFVNDNPFREPFSSQITVRKILYPIDSYISSQPLLVEAIVKAATKIGDEGCYLTQLFQFENDVHHCYIPLSELLEGYTAPECSEKLIGFQIDMDLFNEYILYSAQGKWGLMGSHEYHGMLGGSSEFMEIIEEFLPNLDEQVYDWLRFYQRGKTHKAERQLNPLTLEWLPGLLTHVYGKEKADKMLSETGLP